MQVLQIWGLSRAPGSLCDRLTYALTSMTLTIAAIVTARGPVGRGAGHEAAR